MKIFKFIADRLMGRENYPHRSELQRTGIYTDTPPKKFGESEPLWDRFGRATKAYTETMLKTIFFPSHRYLTSKLLKSSGVHGGRKITIPLVYGST